VFGPTVALTTGAEIIPGGRSPSAPKLLVSGVAGEVRALDDGRRQILRLRLPGDLLYACDYESVVALGRVHVAEARPFLQVLNDPQAPAGLRRAWLELGQADQDMLRDHLVRLGRMTANERVAHFLLETHHRLSNLGLTDGDVFHLPATQEVLSDLIGLSVVHLNRTLQALRRSELISLRNGRVELLGREALAELCDWRPVGAPKMPPVAEPETIAV
jgi:CRP-like cAMP-binding protein